MFTGLKSGKFKMGEGHANFGPGDILFVQRIPGLFPHARARSKHSNMLLLIKTQ